MKRILLATTTLALGLTLAGCKDDNKGNAQSSTYDELNTKIDKQSKEIAELKAVRAEDKTAFEKRLLVLQKAIDEKPEIAAADPETLKTLKETLEKLRTDLAGKSSLPPEDVKSFADRIAALEKLIDAKADVAPVAAAKAAARLLPKHYRQITFVAKAKEASAKDEFRIYGSEGNITIEGTSAAVQITGLSEYLEQVAHVSIGWPGDSLDRLPAKLPAPSGEIKKSASVKNRFALNDTDDGYDDAYKTWPEWERKIDLLALHGINEVFMPVGMEEVYRRTFQDFGYSDEEMRAWIPAPAHQPWWLMQNMAEFGGPMSPALFAHRVHMGQKILARLRELGMTPVFPGYLGTVPTNFKLKNPAAELIPQGEWAALTRPDWLDPRNELYGEIAETFYRKQSELFGNTTMYKMDLLHEGGSAGNVPVRAASRAVKEALQKAHPGAIWVLLGWQSNPLSETLEELKSDEVFIVDGRSDIVRGDRQSRFLSKPYAYGTINNYGGATTLGSRSQVWLKDFFAMHDRASSSLTGIAYLPEAVGHDNAGFELFTELAWLDRTVNQSDWFASYSTYRYGGADEHAAKAWRTLSGTAYSIPSEKDNAVAQDSLFAARPTLDAPSARFWSPEYVLYDETEFAKAVPELLQVAPALRVTSAYRHDLVDVTRQLLANQSRTLLPMIKAAYDRKDKSGFKTLTEKWLDYMNELETLLATDPNFLLGKYLAGARAAAKTDAEWAQLSYNQRSLITVWAGKTTANAGLRDYANREWSGVVSGLYLPRWKAYFASLSTALDNGKEPEAIDWYTMEEAWARKVETLPVAPTGDAYTIATKIFDKLKTEVTPVAPGSQSGTAVVCKVTKSRTC
ncbi:alpha-N-acetylglucosaminidase [Phyllobacterium endophyticum]|uniref:alpha-N-acetylglucosaminidase n=1 Tax=Phyllobacterium endophyticum TaxID=1149773 RepID=UPI0011CA2F4D|nr:alpha-N-acetylglucosaminidase [Phyllobacterium endophyticum]TXR48071.1 alpha-N-acetylglucosaminidase [Phyllobacterium endophyticum]